MDEEKELHFAPFRCHERILNNGSKMLESKVEALIEIWRKLGKLNINIDRNLAAEILNWAKLHTLNIVLAAEWSNLKGTYGKVLIKQVEKAQYNLSQYGKGFQIAVWRLVEVVNCPWDNPTLQNIVNCAHKDAICSKEIEFFQTETAYLVSVRLKKLCDAQCEDLALNLATVFIDCCALTKDNFNGTDDQKWYIFDMFIALLYEFRGIKNVVARLKELSFQEGFRFAERFSNKRIHHLKLWRNSREIAIVALQIYISQIMIKYNNKLRDTLTSFVKLYKSICNTNSLLESFSDSMDRISNLTDSAGLEQLCDILRANYHSALKPLILKTYVKLLTVDMNVKEEQLYTGDLRQVENTNAKLARILTRLGELFDDHVYVARECLLTAFSIFPTKARLRQIENLARRSGVRMVKIEKHVKCKHQPVFSSDNVHSQCSCDELIGKPEVDWPKTDITLHEAMQYSVLGISETLCDDLVVCLSSPRNKMFSWLLPWDDLHRLCVTYLKTPQATKNIIKELNYVNIDYSEFKNMKRKPINFFEGIENGYEHYIYPDFGIKLPNNHVLSKRGKSSEKTDAEEKLMEVIMASNARVNLERLDYEVDSNMYENEMNT